MEELRNILIKTVTTKNNIEKLFEVIVFQENNENHLNIKLIIEEFSDPFNSYVENDKIYLKKSLLEKIDYSSDLSKKNNIYWLIKNLYHEIGHLHQFEEAKQGVLTDGSMFYIITNLIHDYLDASEYTRNYKYQEIEIKANQFAWERVLNILGENVYFQEVIKNIKQQQKYLKWLELILNRTTKDNKLISVWEIFPKNIDKVIKENPKVLEEYQILTKFYKKDGTPKLLVDILTDMDISQFYENIKLWMNRKYFLEIMNQDVTQLRNFSEEVKKRYIELLERIGKDYILNFNELQHLSIKEKNFTIEEYKKLGGLILKKIDELININAANNKVLLELKNSLD